MRAMLEQASIAALIAAFAAALLLLSPAARRYVLDRPNERSLHDKPVPRTGGIAIAAGVAVAYALARPGFAASVFLALALAAISFADDLYEIPVWLRIIAHLAASAVFLALEVPEVELVSFVLVVLALAWAANLYNFMDGSDGLAGGMAVIGFGAYAIAARAGGAEPLAVLSASISAASAGFLLLNFHPARLFMGDVGSVPLGFLAGALGVVGWQGGLWPAWFPILVFAPFIGDATLTLVRRLLRGERVWQAHKDHYYQRLVRMNFGHRGTAVVGYVVMLACAAMALFGRTQPIIIQIFGFLATVAGLAAIAAWVDLRWSQFNRAA